LVNPTKEDKMRSFFLLLTCAILTITVKASPAEAASFYWYRGQVHAHSEEACYSFAKSAAQKGGVTNIKKDNLSVSGTSTGNLVVITCIVAASGNATAIVMVSGDDGPSAGGLAKKLFESMQVSECVEGC
jgi:hypothetical protein